MAITITEEEIMIINKAIRNRDAMAFQRICAEHQAGAPAEWTCIGVVAAVLIGGLFLAGYAVGRTSALREAKSAAVVEEARHDGLAMLTGAVALCASNGDAAKAARFVEERMGRN